MLKSFWRGPFVKTVQQIKKNNKKKHRNYLEFKTGRRHQNFTIARLKKTRLEKAIQTLTELDVVFTVKITEDGGELIIHHIPQEES